MKLIQLLLLVFSVALAAGAAVGESGQQAAGAAVVESGPLAAGATVGESGQAVGESGPLAAGAAVGDGLQAGSIFCSVGNWWDYLTNNQQACGSKVACHAACNNEGGSTGVCMSKCDDYWNFWKFHPLLRDTESEADCERRCNERATAGSGYDEREGCRDSCKSYWETCGDGGTVRPLCPDDVSSCGSWDDANSRTHCSGGRHFAGYLANEEACLTVCGLVGARCCERYLRDDGGVNCLWSSGSGVRENENAHENRKAVSCSAPGDELPDEDAMSGMKAELMIGGALDALAMEAEEFKAVKDLKKNYEDLKEANAALEEELAALRRLAAAEEEEDEAKATESAPDGSDAVFGTLNKIRVMLHDDAAEAERGAVPKGEGEGGPL